MLKPAVKTSWRVREHQKSCAKMSDRLEDSHGFDVKSVSLTARASLQQFWPLDCAAISQETFEILGGNSEWVLIDAGVFHFSCVAIVEDSVEEGFALVPPWFLEAVGASDSTVVRLTAVPSQPTSYHAVMEGPFCLSGTAATASFFALGRSHLHEAVLRQLQRSSIPCVPGAGLVAAKISGQTLIFRVLAYNGSRNDAGAKFDSEGGAQDGCVNNPYVFTPTTLSIRQPLEPLASIWASKNHKESGNIDVAADLSIEALREFSPLGVRQGTGTFAGPLLEGAPRPREMLFFLSKLRDAALRNGFRGICHLPLLELIRDLPTGGPSALTLRKLLRAYFDNLLADDQTEAGSLLCVLWGLDGPLPEGAGTWINEGLLPLAPPPPGCVLLGLCGFTSGVRNAIASAFGTATDETQGIRSLNCSRERNPQLAVVSDEDVPPIIGNNETLSRLRSSVLTYYVDHALFSTIGVNWPPRVLIHGPAGSGKTHLLRWLCAQMPKDVSIQWLHPGEIWSRYLGDSEAKLRSVFAKAAAANVGAGSLLIIENLDQLAPARKGGTSNEGDGLRDRIVATLLVSLDGIDTPACDGGPGFGVIATSCTPAEMLDSRVTRPGRFDCWLGVDSLSDTERLDLLRNFVENVGRERNDVQKASADYKMPAETDEEIKTAIVTASKTLRPAELRLVARRAWNALRPSGSGPEWADVLLALRGRSLQDQTCAAVNHDSAQDALCSSRDVGENSNCFPSASTDMADANKNRNFTSTEPVSASVNQACVKKNIGHQTDLAAEIALEKAVATTLPSSDEDGF